MTAAATAPTTVDPITLEVIRHRFDSIANEMELTLLRSAFSSTIKEARDASAALFDLHGQTIAQALAIPCHLGMLVPAVRRVIEVFPPATMRAGDVFILNDPYDGGTHLPDISIVAPVVHDGHVVALAASIAHHQDVGGKVPGSTPPDATEIFQEGVIIPPLRLYTEGVPNDTLFALLARNSRLPDELTGDLRAQVASARVGARRFSELCADYGEDFIARCTSALMDYAERLTRHHIEGIPDGEYSFSDFMDDDGIVRGRPLELHVSVRVAGSSIEFDFTGSSPQVAGAVNSVPASTLATVYYAVRAVTDPHLPNNAGCYRPIRMTLPSHSLVNPDWPAPVSARTATTKRLADVVLGALAQAVPDRVPAAGSGQLATVFTGGTDPATGRVYVTGSALPTAGGTGARPTKDGIDVLDTDVTNVMTRPVEAIESRYPIRVLHCRLWTDSGGAGRYRGGLGYEGAWTLLRGEAVVTCRRDRHLFTPWGLQGGQPAPTCRWLVRRADGICDELPSKCVTQLRAGDVFEVYTTGGGGFGDPLERQPARVLDDVLDARVSVQAAAEQYGVLFTPSLDAVDGPATDEQRQTLWRQRPTADSRTGPRTVPSQR